ncbi:hypothetical protein GCM10028796_06210 [Ramlibacter monticola]
MPTKLRRLALSCRASSQASSAKLKPLEHQSLVQAKHETPDRRAWHVSQGRNQAAGPGVRATFINQHTIEK